MPEPTSPKNATVRFYDAPVNGKCVGEVIIPSEPSFTILAPVECCSASVLAETFRSKAATLAECDHCGTQWARENRYTIMWSRSAVVA